MRNIKYIIVKDEGSKGSVCSSRHRFIPHIGHCMEVEAPGFKCQGAGSRLLDELVRLRRQWPDAKILGMSELNGRVLNNRDIVVSDAMNALRHALSNLP